MLNFSEYPLRPEFNLHEQKTSDRYSEICGYHYQNFGGGNKRHHHLDANAMEFIPKAESADSGNGSGSSSEEDNSGSEGRSTSIALRTCIRVFSTSELNVNVEEYVLLKLNTCYIIIVNQ